jgi:hypothetical protein
LVHSWGWVVSSFRRSLPACLLIAIATACGASERSLAAAAARRTNELSKSVGSTSDEI